MEVIASTPDHEGEYKEYAHDNSGTHGTAEVGGVEEDAEDPGADDLRHVVENVVEGTGTNVEVGEILGRLMSVYPESVGE